MLRFCLTTRHDNVLVATLEPSFGWFTTTQHSHEQGCFHYHQI